MVTRHGVDVHRLLQLIPSVFVHDATCSSAGNNDNNNNSKNQ